MAVARAGGPVSLVGAVGEDGAWLVRDLEGYSVSTANISVIQVRYAPVFPRRTCCPDNHDLAVICIFCCRRRSPAALSFNLLRKAKIASVRVSQGVITSRQLLSSIHFASTQSYTREQTAPFLILLHRVMSNDTLLEFHISFYKTKSLGAQYARVFPNTRMHEAS